VDDVLIQFPIVDVWMCMDFLPLPAQSSDNTNNTIQNMSQFAAESDDTRIAALFAEFDVDGGGSIDASEFQQLAYACGEVLSDEETAAVVKALDADNNGTIDLNEFKTWLNGFDGSNESDPLAMAKSALLRAKLFGRSMEKSLRTASAKASDIVKFDPTAATPVSVSCKLQLGKEEDIKFGAALKLESLSQEERNDIGGQAKIDVVIACKEGTTDMQVGTFVGRINTLCKCGFGVVLLPVILLPV
jgi:hypothetical protein